MPIGYLVTTGGLAAVALSAVLRHRPRRSSPFRPSYVFGLWLNWPLFTFLLLAASTALAIDQSGFGSPGLWTGIGLAVVVSVGLLVLRERAQATGPVLERALDDGLGADWRDHVDPGVAARLRRRPSLRRILLAPISSRLHGVTRMANIRYGRARRANLLDLYLDRSPYEGRPALVYLHPLRGSKRLGARHLLHRLAGRGWVCVSANYRRGPAGDSASLTDVEKVICWVREHGREYGVDPRRVFLAGSSLGGGLALLAALETSVAGAISLYGYYGPVAAGRMADAPPCFVAHGDQDTLVTVDDARGFVEQLAPPRRTRSSTPSCRARSTASISSARVGWTSSSMRSRRSPAA